MFTPEYDYSCLGFMQDDYFQDEDSFYLEAGDEWEDSTDLIWEGEEDDE
jgi:hypothetical protein